MICLAYIGTHERTGAITRSVADRHFPYSRTVIKIFPKHVFFSSISRHNPHQGKAHFKFFKPKGPSVYNLSSALIITKLTWHKQPPILAGAALGEVITALWEPRQCYWSSQKRPVWMSTRSQVKDTAHIFLSKNARWI